MGPVDAWDAMVAAWRMPGGAPAETGSMPPPTTGTPSRRWAHEALPVGGTVLDVGCGVGAASLPLADRAGRIVAVDADPGRTAAFEARAKALDLAYETVIGVWPDVAEEVPVADVVVCHHVLHHAPGLESFVTALTRHARERVVVELPLAHPHEWLRPVWGELGGDEDAGPAPTTADALAALDALGLTVHVVTWDDPWAGRSAELVRSVRERLAGMPAEVAPPWPRRVATLWWAGGGPGGGGS